MDGIIAIHRRVYVGMFSSIPLVLDASIDQLQPLVENSSLRAFRSAFELCFSLLCPAGVWTVDAKVNAGLQFNSPPRKHLYDVVFCWVQMG